ncbi:MAG: helix-turn-helix domain-containing protein [Nakamurella sp.]
MEIAQLLLHPVRLRIVNAGMDGRPFTTSQLCARLPDISKATVYRQVAVLVDGGMVEVTGEERVRGAVERTYRLHPARAAMDAEAVAAMTTADHQRGFAAAIAALLAEFNVYISRNDSDPLADSVSYRQFSLWLTEEEKATFIEEMVAIIRARLSNGPSPERKRHLASTILFPADSAD